MEIRFELLLVLSIVQTTAGVQKPNVCYTIIDDNLITHF